MSTSGGDFFFTNLQPEFAAWLHLAKTLGHLLGFKADTKNLPWLWVEGDVIFGDMILRGNVNFNYS